MNEQHTSETGFTGGTGADRAAALFAQLIIQQTNMAMMLLGHVAHPESGKVVKDIDAARMFIDQLEVLETKTKGNLSKDESNLLKQSLMNLRLAFVQAVESNEPQETATPASSAAAAAPSAKSAEDTVASAPAGSTEDEHRKKFSKKY